MEKIGNEKQNGIISRWWEWEEYQRLNEPVVSAIRWSVHGFLIWVLLAWFGYL